MAAQGSFRSPQDRRPRNSLEEARVLTAQFELKHLRYAVAATRYRSFRKAADALGIKQSTLSRGIAQLEARLGVILFERTSGGVLLTMAGREILRTSTHLVETLDQMISTARNIGNGDAGHITVGFYTSLSAGNLRASLVEYAARFPKVDIQTHEGARACLFAGVDSGRIDIAITTGDPIARDGNVMALWSERIIVALPEGHRLAGNNIVYWTDLKDETFLLSQRDPGPEIQDILLSKLAAPGERPRVVSHDITRENIKSLVGAGFGVSLMCEACIGANYPGLVYREARDGNGPSRISYTAYWRSDNSNPALAGFISLLKERHPSVSVGD